MSWKPTYPYKVTDTYSTAFPGADTFHGVTAQTDRHAHLSELQKVANRVQKLEALLEHIAATHPTVVSEAMLAVEAKKRMGVDDASSD